MESSKEPPNPPPLILPRLVRKRGIRSRAPSLVSPVSLRPVESLLRNPSDSFPHLLAGLSLQLDRKSQTSATKVGLETVFMMVSHKAFYISIAFKDDRRSLVINPLHVQFIEIEAEMSMEEGKWTSDFTSKLKGKQIFKTILKYGTKISPEELVFNSHARTLAEILQREIRNLKSYVLSLTYNSQLEMFLYHQFDLISNLSLVSPDSLCNFIKSVTGHVSEKTVRNYVSEDKAGLDINEFITIYRTLINMQKQQSKALTVLFYRWCLESSDRRQGRMGQNSFEKFLTEEQEDSDTECVQIVVDNMQKYTTRPHCRRSSIQPHLTFEDYLDYLFSPQNSILDPKQVNILGHQDDSQPLTDYFINTSHNTYLTGNQLKSESSVDIYARLLRKGVRCLELDCWDGSDGNPIITHGNTLCTKVRFSDVVKCIANNAFAEGNLYPVILSIENHCSLAQQVKMSEIFKEEFKDMLLTEPINESLLPKQNRLPSPKQLFGKIILKDKKLANSRKHKDSSVSITSKDGDYTRIEEERFLENTVMVLFENDSEWRSATATFVGPNIEISWFETESETETKPPTEQMEPPMPVLERRENVDEEDNDASHLDHLTSNKESKKEKIHIAALRRDQADVLLQLHSGMIEGSFVIRKNERSNVVISVLHNAIVYHVQFEVEQTEEETLYRIGDKKSSLDNVIDYYRFNPMVLVTRLGPSPVYLKDQIPENQLFQVQDWYIPELKDQMTNQLLMAAKEDGVFLLRDSTNRSRRILSFNSKNNVYHVYIDQKEDKLEIGGVESNFQSITEFIQFYQTRPLFETISLGNPYGSGGPVLTEPTILKDSDSEEDDKCVKDFDNFSRYLSGVELNIENYNLNDTRTELRTSLQNKKSSNGETEKLITSTFTLKDAEVELFLHKIGLPDSSNSTTCLKVTSSDGLFHLTTRDEQLLREFWAQKFQEVTSGAISTSEVEDPIPSNGNKKRRVAQELSDLIVYCQSVPYSSKVENEVINLIEGSCNLLCSFNETKAKSVMVEHNRIAFQRYHQRQFSRIYPKGTRTDSSNFNPVPFWCSGAQLVALNFQTPDKELQINNGWFLQNGGCGYVLKPKYLREGCFDPQTSVVDNDSFHLKIAILSGRHLTLFTNKGVSISPFVKLEVIGCPIDCVVGTTEVCSSNSFNPSWDLSFDFGIIHRPHLAVLRISIYNQIKNPVPANELLCQATLPLAAIRTGFRSVQLRNGFGDVENGLSVLLLKVEKNRVMKDEENSIQLIFKRLLDLHSKEKTLENISQLEDLSEDDEILKQEVAEEIRTLEGRLMRELAERTPQTSAKASNIKAPLQVANSTPAMFYVGTNSSESSPSPPLSSTPSQPPQVSFGTLPRKVTSKKFSLQMTKHRDSESK